MSMKEFSKNDIFRSSLVTYPKYEFKIFKGDTFSTNYAEGILKFGETINNEHFDVLIGVLDFSDEDNSGLIALI